ncbi:hypothetical protein VPH35_080728 [Triticum aestivum]|uniref:Uncharacterized protein n=1 Tax=Aegilops tauschii TaxID=37682 RepID=R7W220_AEGTA
MEDAGMEFLLDAVDRTSGEVLDLVGASAYWSCDDLVERADLDLERHLLKDDCFTTFAAHRCVLAARSTVLRAELYGAMKESGVQIDGMRAEVFRHLLHFVYTDSLPEEEEGDGVAMAQHLMEAADRYGMERLKLLYCWPTLAYWARSATGPHMDVSTVATTLSSITAKG